MSNKKASKYRLETIKTVEAANGTKIIIGFDGTHEWCPLVSIAKSLNYGNNLFSTDRSLLQTAFKAANATWARFRYDVKPSSSKDSVLVSDAIRILEKFIKLTLTTRCVNQNQLDQMDVARVEAQNLIEILNREVFNLVSEIDNEQISVNAISKEETDTSLDDNNFRKLKEELIMENVSAKTPQTPVPVVSVEEITDISDRAEALVKLFGVSKKDALRAATQLKAQEINRDLAPLMELLG